MQLDFCSFQTLDQIKQIPTSFKCIDLSVIFGVNVSPFLLSATIKQQHIENYREQYPAATEMLDTGLYVDDVISGADDISQALKLSKDAETIMKNASMKLRKWNSNDQTLMRTWEREGLETHPRHPDDSSKIPSSKVLGIPWDVVHDYFTIDVKGLLQLDTSKPITKRIVLQSAGKIYDPVGFLSPYTIRLKCLLQELWLRKLSWDDELPPDIHAVWSQWCKGSQENPRSEVFNQSLFLTDSQVTLHWIKGPSHRWKPFVANRVREIQSLTDPNSWFHCSGKDNPADRLTRGISVDALTTNSKWWNGSSFLRQIDFQTKGLDEAIPERVYLTEMRKNSNPKEDISLTLTVTKNNFLENIIDISNNYVKLIRVVSFLYRFIHNCRTRITKIKGPLTSQEVSHAENWLIHSLHEREFYEEMRKLLAGTLVLIKDENLPSTKWSTGRITEIFPGTDAHHPQTNGKDERVNQSLVTRLKCKVNASSTKIPWKKILDKVCNEHNSTPNSIIKYPPAYLLFGLLPYQSPIDQNNYYEAVDEARELALQRTIDYHIKNKIRYDARCIEKQFNPGDLVVYEEFQYPNTRKLSSPFSGPYEIIKQCSEVTYEINKPNSLVKKDFPNCPYF
ncbi:integrase catalytic domain-containing protein [Trichonephila clavipes]|nr:integrase catalytic domain-containing protein [Trichonephila clavipes]